MSGHPYIFANLDKLSVTVTVTVTVTLADSEEYRKGGSVLDMFQAKRQPGAQEGGVVIPDSPPMVGVCLSVCLC